MPECPPPGMPRISPYLLYEDVAAALDFLAKAFGAKVLGAPEDKFYGDRSYMVEDLAGHQWSFATHVRDVPMDEMEKAASELANKSS